MSTLKVLKEYLVGEDGYLLNDDNNGKTVMLSGAWGRRIFVRMRLLHEE